MNAVLGQKLINMYIYNDILRQEIVFCLTSMKKNYKRKYTTTNKKYKKQNNGKSS